MRENWFVLQLMQIALQALQKARAIDVALFYIGSRWLGEIETCLQWLSVKQNAAATNAK